HRPAERSPHLPPLRLRNTDLPRPTLPPTLRKPLPPSTIRWHLPTVRRPPVWSLRPPLCSAQHLPWFRRSPRLLRFFPRRLRPLRRPQLHRLRSTLLLRPQPPRLKSLLLRLELLPHRDSRRNCSRQY